MDNATHRGSGHGFARGVAAWLAGLFMLYCLLLPVTGCSGGPNPFVTALTCASSSMKGAGQVSCSVALNTGAPGSGQGVNLISSNLAVVIPPSIMVPARASGASFTGNVSAVGTQQYVTLTASAGGFSKSFTLNLAAANPTLAISPVALAFGNVEENRTSTQILTLQSKGDLPITITGATTTGIGFSVGKTSFPMTLNPGQSQTLNVNFAPTTVGPVNGNVIIASNSSGGTSTVVGLTGAGVPAITVTVNPATVQLMTGSAQLFTATLTNTTNTTVDWSVSGTGCTGAACGTITSAGQYTAPAGVPTPNALTITATSEADPTAVGNAAVTIVKKTGNTYYLAPTSAGGSDSNDGLTSNTPWESPNHPLNCGDVIMASPSTDYQYWEFNWGKWGTVSCPTANSVAWLQCATFDGCKITSGGGMIVDQSFWGVQGWEVTADLPYAPCFAAAANQNNPVGEIHHLIFANNVANGCLSGGFISYNNWTNLAAGVDYINVVGNIAYNGTQGATNCYSGISIYEPIQSDSLPGTHIFVAGNFSYGNIQPSPCAGWPAPGADGIIFDTFDGSQANLPVPYAAQAVAENNILIGNNGRGVEVQNNTAATKTSSGHAPVYVLNNTSWGNGDSSTTSAVICGEIVINQAFDTDMEHNLAMTTGPTGCGGHTLNGFQAYNGDGSDTVDKNFVYSADGNNFYNWGTGPGGTGTATFGSNNITGQDPKFANASVPGAPTCDGTENVPACMASVIANFTPGNASASAYGYQLPSSTPGNDPLFPAWLCNVNLPSGLVTTTCQQ